MTEGYAIHELEQFAKSSNMFEKLRNRLLGNLKAQGVPERSIIALKSHTDVNVHDTDGTYELYFESFAFNITGLKQTDLEILIEVDSAQVHVFIPRFSEIVQIFLKPCTPEIVSAEYGYKAYYTEEFNSVLEKLNPSCIYLNKGLNTDSKVDVPSSYLRYSVFDKFVVNEELLYPVFARCRSVKTQEEVEVMRRVIRASSEAHVQVMKHCKAGLFEYALAGVFRAHVAVNYGYIYSFCPISACGPQGAVLHYPHMDQPIVSGHMMLCDMGAYGYGYSSDIACTFPVDGKFTPNQASIYSLVLKANRSVVSAMKPGVEWTDMHLLAEKVIIEGLIDLQVLQGNSEEIQNKRIGAVFFPHGLGHLLGHDTHDVGGYICGHQRSTEPGIRCLRTRRTLEAGMIITVEPGIYFIDVAIEQALCNEDFRRFFGPRLEEFRGFGGVRIEDDVLVTEHGAEILTNVPRTVEEIERVMAGGEW